MFREGGSHVTVILMVKTVVAEMKTGRASGVGKKISEEESMKYSTVDTKKETRNKVTYMYI